MTCNSLQNERIHRQRYRTRAEARLEVFQYIEGFYNSNRRPSTLGQVSRDWCTSYFTSAGIERPDTATAEPLLQFSHVALRTTPDASILDRDHCLHLAAIARRKDRGGAVPWP